MRAQQSLPVPMLTTGIGEAGTQRQLHYLAAQIVVVVGVHHCLLHQPRAKVCGSDNSIPVGRFDQLP